MSEEREFLEELNKLDGWEFWQLVLENKKNLVVYLDNDQTFVMNKKNLDDDFYAEPSDYLGNSSGLTDLLDALDVNWEHV